MDAPATSAWISRAGMAAAGTPESWMPSMKWHVGCIRTACAAHLVNSKGKHHVNPMSNCQTVQWTLLGTCNANVVLGIFAWRQRLHGIAMYMQFCKKNKSMHMVEMLTGWMHLQHQHGSRAQEWQQQEHLSHECRQWSDMLDAYELLVLLT